MKVVRESQGKVREFCKNGPSQGKVWEFGQSQGKVREFGNLDMPFERSMSKKCNTQQLKARVKQFLRLSN